MPVHLADLPDALLGWTARDSIWIDQDAAGYGWYIGVSPTFPAAFTQVTGDHEAQAAPGSPAYGHVDLLTVVTHELGHILGFASIDPALLDHDWMTATLGTGVRRYPGSGRGQSPPAAGGPTPITTDRPALGGVGVPPTQPADVTGPVPPSERPSVSPDSGPSGNGVRPGDLGDPGSAAPPADPAPDQDGAGRAGDPFAPPLLGPDPFFSVGGPAVEVHLPGPVHRVEEWPGAGSAEVIFPVRRGEPSDPGPDGGTMRWVDGSAAGLPTELDEPVELPRVGAEAMRRSGPG